MVQCGTASETSTRLALSVRWSIVILFLGSVAWAQTFEVTSLKPSGPQSGNRIEGGPGTSDPIRYGYTSATLEDLIVIAWNVEYFQVSSKSVIDRDCFDLLAKIPPGTRKEQFRIMLQNLLIERFRLKLHLETREFSGYALVVARTGFKLYGRTHGPATSRGHSAPDGFPDLPPDRLGIISHHFMVDGHELVRMRVQQMPMSEIARSLHVPGEVPVVDQTGLTGKYEFTLEYAAPARDSQAVFEMPTAASVFTAVQQQLGLQLISKRVPFNVVVVDSFSRVPSEN
jgi:uncharacterized protein (TIGR03435 family)